jgi:hypothetical protein
VFAENHRAVALLRSSLVSLSRNIGAGTYDFPELDPGLACEMFVGDINIFSASNRRPFHFVSSHAARTMGYADQEMLMNVGGLNILARHYKKLEAIYWVRHLLALPRNEDIRCIDYIARNKVMQRSGKLGFEERRYLACNLEGYRGRSDIICIGIDPTNLDREAIGFAIAVHPDPDVRARTEAMRLLSSGRRRLRVFLSRARKMPPARIAERMGISINTVNEHLAAIYRILDLNEDKLVQMIEFATRAGLKGSVYDEPPPLDNDTLFEE